MSNKLKEFRMSKWLSEETNNHGACADMMLLNDSITSILTNHMILEVKLFISLGDLIMLDNDLNIILFMA